MIKIRCMTMAGTALVVVAFATQAQAQCFHQAYRVVYQTVYDQRQTTAYRIEYETVYDQRQVTRYRPVWETQMRERRYTVARPIIETSEREERYTVMRPVWETSEREERYTVRRQVVETSEREEVYTVMKPVTTMRTQYVDQGGYVDQQTVVPGAVRNRLTWMPGGFVTDPMTGAAIPQRAGLVWVPTQAPSRVTVNRVWQPNVVAQEVPVTEYVPTQMTRKVPVQTVRYVDEEFVRKVPVRTCRMVAEERVRRVPVTTRRIVYEEKVEQYPVRVYKTVATVETVQVPRLVEKRIPVTYTYRVPRRVAMRVPIESCGCGGTPYYVPGVAVPQMMPQPTSPTRTYQKPVTPAEKADTESDGPILSPGEDSKGQTPAPPVDDKMSRTTA